MSQYAIICLLVLLPALPPALLPGGSASAGFIPDGFGSYSSAFDPGSREIRAVAVQRDGKIVIGGIFQVKGGGPQNLARLLTDGTLDAGFAASANGAVNALAVEPDPGDPAAQLILVGGKFSSVTATSGGAPSTQPRHGLARLRADSVGTLDAGFDPANETGTEINAIALQPGAGSILVGGTFSEMAGEPCGNVARISDAGGAFQGNLAGGVSGGEVDAIVVQGGRVLLGGSFGAPRTHLARYDAGDALDAFQAAPDGTVRALALLTEPDGELVLGGDFTQIVTDAYPAGATRRHLARFRRDDTLDDFDPGTDGSVTALAVQPDGRTVAAGNFSQVGYGAPTARNHAARFLLDGTLDAGCDPNAADPVKAVALQSDGKFLIGGKFAQAAGKTRTMLARFEVGGRLDDNVTAVGPQLYALDEQGGVIDVPVLTVSQQQDGTLGIGGSFSFIGPYPRMQFARLHPDWSPFMEADLGFDNQVNVVASLPDGRMIVGGSFDDGVNLDSSSVVLVNADGTTDPVFAQTIVDLLDFGITGAVAFSPTGTLQPDGQPDFDIFLGGGTWSQGVARVYRFNSRLEHTGSLDLNGIDPVLLKGFVMSLAVEPAARPEDNKVLVGTNRGTVLRFNARDGNLDTSFPPKDLGDAIFTIAPLPDGNLLICGAFSQSVTRNGFTWDQSVLRIKSGGADVGAIDTSFNLEVGYPGAGHDTDSCALHADGSMTLGGSFDLPEGVPGLNVIDVNRVNVLRHNVLRLKPNGELDQDFDLGMVGGYYLDPGKMGQIKALPDGKLILAGGFLSVGGDPDRKQLARIATTKAGTQLLSVQPEPLPAASASITWQRSGSAPEIWQAWFEYLDPSVPGGRWEFLGYGERVAPTAGSGWQLKGKALPRGSNLYLRARGYATPERGSVSTLMESVRLFYLPALSGGKADQTMTLALPGKSYGDPDFSAQPSVSRGGIDTPGLPFGFSSDNGSVATVDPASGLIHITGAGSCTITAIQAGDANYNLAQASAILVVSKADQTVTLTLPGKSYGDPDFLPVVTVTRGGAVSAGLPITLSSDDLVAGITPGGLIHLTAAGSGSITAVQAGDANYNQAQASAVLVVARADQSISLVLPGKSYGDPDFLPVVIVTRGGVVSAGLPITLSSDNLVAGITPGGLIHLTAAGSGSITATQAGDANYHQAQASAVLAVAKADQIVTLTLPGKSYGDPDFLPGVALTRLGTVVSGLPVSFSTDNTVAGVTPGGLIHITGAGSGTVTVLQPGDANFNPITRSRTLVVAPKALSVTADDKTRAFGTENPQLTARFDGFVNCDTLASVAMHGSPVLSTTARLDSPVGSYPIAVSVDDPASRLSTPNYSFLPVNGALNVVQSCQEIVFPQPGERTYGDAPFQLQASACSGLTISFRFLDPGQQVATLSGNTLSITGAGSVVITASQGGSGDLQSAPEVSRTLVVHKSGQSIAFQPLHGKRQGDAPFDLTPPPAGGLPIYASTSSGLPLVFQSSEPAVAEVTGSTVTIKGAGTAVVTASQSGNANYNAALPVSQPLVIAAEAVPPVLSLSSLSSGACTSNPVLNLMGTAGDPSGIASLTLNGVDLTGEAALFSCAVQLAAGENRIEITARDRFGNQATQTLMITLDATGPALSLRMPADNCVTDQPWSALSGSVTPGSAVSVSVNGGPGQLLEVSNGSFSGSVPLQIGINTIELAAAGSGRISRVKRSVTLAPGQPSLAILEPAEDLRTEQASLVLRGTVGEGASVLLEVAGQSFAPAVQGGAFQQTIDLERPGIFAVRAWATGPGGAKALAQRNLVRVPLILGDLDGDGCVGIGDAAAAMRISLGLDPATPRALAHGDVAPLLDGVPHPDGVIDAGDVLVLLRKIVGLVAF